MNTNGVTVSPKIQEQPQSDINDFREQQKTKPPQKGSKMKNKRRKTKTQCDHKGKENVEKRIQNDAYKYKMTKKYPGTQNHSREKGCKIIPEIQH